MPRRAEDLTGRHYNMLTVIKRDYSKRACSWFCKCDCGNPNLVSV